VSNRSELVGGTLSNTGEFRCSVMCPSSQGPRRLTKASAAARSLRERLAAMDVRDLRSLIANRGTRLRSYEALRG
jgi:hypothetical protein